MSSMLRSHNGATRLYRGSGGWNSIRSASPFLRHSLTPPLSRLLSTEQLIHGRYGHIGTGPNEGILFLGNVFPFKLQWLHRIPWLNMDALLVKRTKAIRDEGHQHEWIDPLTLVEKALPKSLPLHIEEVIPRIREAGCFVKFKHDPSISTREVAELVQEYLKENPVRAFNGLNPWTRVGAFLVEGRPWIEDLARFPSQRVRVEFLSATEGAAATEMTQESLYQILRPYGKVVDIESQPFDSKVVPRYALVRFSAMQYAIMAKNCMHGTVIGADLGGGKSGTLLQLSYEPVLKSRHFWEWLTNHPRIVIPILVALLGTLAVAIFDPIRTAFIKAHVKKTFDVKDNRAVKWLLSQVSRATDALKRHRAETPNLETVWADRKDEIDQMQRWLLESVDSFIVVQGPRGSGKKELVVGEALKEWKTKLIIDCKPIVEARGDSATIRAAAAEVGYMPVFSWMNNVSSLIDLAAQGTIGMKTGFSETLDGQLNKIWSSSSAALRQLALENRPKDFEPQHSDDEWLEAHPEYRPVVVIDNFLHRAKENSMVYEKLCEWAAAVTTGNIAHVIFITQDVSYGKYLTKALPDRVFRQLTLGDCGPETARKYVLDRIASDRKAMKSFREGNTGDGESVEHDMSELSQCIEVLGGRLTDLDFLARRIDAGEEPIKAVQEIISQAASEILKVFVLDSDHSTLASREFSAVQAWEVIKLLAAQPSRYTVSWKYTTTHEGGKHSKHGSTFESDVPEAKSISYNTLLLSPLFSKPDAALQAMASAELITITSSPTGRPESIIPSKPVYAAAFRRLVDDKALSARMSIATLGELTKKTEADVKEAEAELSTLVGLVGVLGEKGAAAQEVRSRVRWLLAKVNDGQTKIEKWDAEKTHLKNVLSKAEH